MAIIYTSKGQGIMVSEKDHKTLNSFLWYVGKNGYASNDSMPRKLMHRLIMGYPEQNIDHINGNKLDNRRENLRLCTQSGNTANAGKRINNTSGYKGVSWDKKAKRWSVFCTKDYKHVFGGYFDDKKVAAKKYRELSKKLHGEFAKT